VTCGACGSENELGRKFCGECGVALEVTCPSCGTPNPPTVKFCGECGTALFTRDPGLAPAGTTPAAERRLVSVLFADLVGFTTLSDGRDSEETRELLSRYFDACRRLIELYGGTVEKFIGDAVMAVWGTPTATEDDAERAVRAALDLVAAVSALGDEVGAPELRARAGVLTGEAAVTVGAEGQGMVAGDLVNTASRIQSIAEPGTVFVGDATRRATDETIAYESAGSHELKGKVGLVQLYRALRVVSGSRGSLKSAGLEAPFVGRDRELRRIKDLFHECADDGKPHLVSITGIAGIGKSRLAWEFYKYFDGIAQITYWHRGRCLAYGEGVTYWALADMVRMRARIAEDEEAGTALPKLAAVVEEHLADPEERRFVEPRLRHLLALEDGRYERDDLFAAWRLFFERLAVVYPVVLVFEDMQWADQSLLDFIEYLLEWSRASPIYVMTLARPELLERRPTWGAGHRNFTSIYLEPLSAEAMRSLLDGLVPGLPEELRVQILARAEGIPLYAVETVRMLLDRGLLVQDGPIYRPTGTVEALEVPETLHALIAARLDGLPADERRVLQDAAVLGKTFTKHALAGVAGIDDAALEPLLASLTRKEVLGVQADPRSPEHGQYGFLQDLLRKVAYETLSKADRKTRHLAAAAQLEAAMSEGEVVEVVASHYLAAYEAAPEADDATEIRDSARRQLANAGDRAASLGAAAEARRYYVHAAELTDDPRTRAALLHRAGDMAARAADPDSARDLFDTSIALYEGLGDMHAAARVLYRLARVDAFTGHRDEAQTRMQRAFEVTSGDPPDEDLALLAARLALGYQYSGDLGRAAERAEFALDIAEAHAYPAALAVALRARAGVAQGRGHFQEAEAILERALGIALEHDVLDEAGTCYFWLSDRCFQRDAYVEALAYLDESLAQTRRRGDRPSEWSVLSERTYPLVMLGRWEEAEAAIREFTPEQIDTGGLLLSMLQSSVEIHAKRGELEEARSVLALFSRLEESTDTQELSTFLSCRAELRLADAQLQDALADGQAAVDAIRSSFGISAQSAKHGLIAALEAAWRLGDSGQVEELLVSIESLPPGTRPPYLDAQATRFRTRIEGDAVGYDAAAARFRGLGIVFWEAVTLLEHAELLVREDRRAEAAPLLESARAIFERLRATPWLDRVAAVSGHTEVVV
jgi:class 3 adenylate cyclase/tetratricopeptide (TPR) repeat protein